MKLEFLATELEVTPQNGLEFNVEVEVEKRTAYSIAVDILDNLPSDERKEIIESYIS